MYKTLLNISFLLLLCILMVVVDYIFIDGQTFWKCNLTTGIFFQLCNRSVHVHAIWQMPGSVALRQRGVFL